MNMKLGLFSFGSVPVVNYLQKQEPSELELAKQ